MLFREIIIAHSESHAKPTRTLRENLEDVSCGLQGCGAHLQDREAPTTQKSRVGMSTIVTERNETVELRAYSDTTKLIIIIFTAHDYKLK